jgi:HEAT repeat protein
LPQAWRACQFIPSSSKKPGFQGNLVSSEPAEFPGGLPVHAQVLGDVGRAGVRGPGAGRGAVRRAAGDGRLAVASRNALALAIALLETALDEAAWDAFSSGAAIRRAGRAGFARDVCVGLGNWGSQDAVPVLSRALSDPESLVRSHAAWALGRVGPAEARSALSAGASVESDASVLAELSVAMDA